MFSGPMSKDTPLGVEIEACKHVWRILGVHFSNSNSFICTDSKNLQEMANKVMQGGHDTRVGFTDIQKLASLFPKVKICYINRIGIMWLTVYLNKVERE